MPACFSFKAVIDCWLSEHTWLKKFMKAEQQPLPIGAIYCSSVVRRTVDNVALVVPVLRGRLAAAARYCKHWPTTPPPRAAHDAVPYNSCQ